MGDVAPAQKREKLIMSTQYYGVSELNFFFYSNTLITRRTKLRKPCPNSECMSFCPTI